MCVEICRSVVVLKVEDGVGASKNMMIRIKECTIGVDIVRITEIIVPVGLVAFSELSIGMNAPRFEVSDAFVEVARFYSGF